MDDDNDFSERDIDPGDFRFCSDCNEWTLMTERTETTDEHKIIKIYSCPCGAVQEEI